MIDSQPQGLVYQLVAFLRKISGSHFKHAIYIKWAVVHITVQGAVYSFYGDARSCFTWPCASSPALSRHATPGCGLYQQSGLIEAVRLRVKHPAHNARVHPCGTWGPKIGRAHV